jgi:pimeloyl-ACP methyl ester carboxylesterase
MEPMRAETASAIEEHRAAGREFEAGGVRSFVREQGSGDPVVLMHGVPVSSFVYRKLLPLLVERGLRAVAFDLPGTGLADRPREFDYSWSGLGRWTAAAIDSLEIDRCHLVLHDIGGPVGLEWGLRDPERILSLTAMDTMLDVGRFRRIWSMQILAIPVVGEIWIAASRPPVARWLYYRQGIADRSVVPSHEVDAQLALARREDGGRALLRIVRGFELSDDKERFYRDGLSALRCPRQVVWGERDPALGESRRLAAQEMLGVDEALLLPAKHFLQEEQAPAVARAIARIAETG